jgi:hypothetical protein
MSNAGHIVPAYYVLTNTHAFIYVMEIRNYSARIRGDIL